MPCSTRASSKVSNDCAVTAMMLAMQYSAMPSISTGRRPKRSDSGPITNCPMPKPIRKVDSTSCGRLASVMWKAEAMFGSAGSIMSIASGLSAMIEAITRTNSGKPIGRWLDETQELEVVEPSVTRAPHVKRTISDYVAMHNGHCGMADAQLMAGRCGRPPFPLCGERSRRRRG